MKEVDVVEIVNDIIQVQINGAPKNTYFIADIFNVIAMNNVNIDMISQMTLEEETRLGFTCKTSDQTNLNRAIDELTEKYPNINAVQNRTVAQVNVEGEGMKEATGVAAKLYKVIGNYNVPIHQVATSLTTISFIMDSKDAKDVAEAIKILYNL